MLKKCGGIFVNKLSSLTPVLKNRSCVDVNIDFSKIDFVSTNVNIDFYKNRCLMLVNIGFYRNRCCVFFHSKKPNLQFHSVGLLLTLTTLTLI